MLVSSGDPLFYGVARYLCDRLGKDLFEVVPHVSSMQLAFARVKESWEDATLINLAGQADRGGDRPHPDRGEDRVVLERASARRRDWRASSWSAASITSGLIVCENLGSPDERVTQAELADLTGHGIQRAQRLDLDSQAEPA